MDDFVGLTSVLNIPTGDGRIRTCPKEHRFRKLTNNLYGHSATFIILCEEEELDRANFDTTERTSDDVTFWAMAGFTQHRAEYLQVELEKAEQTILEFESLIDKIVKKLDEVKP